MERPILHVDVAGGPSSSSGSDMAMEEIAQPPLDQSLRRIARTADDLAAAIQGQSAVALARRPGATAWAAVEVICHLRDIEELRMARLEMIAAMDEPMIPAAGMGARALGLKPDGHPAAPDRWAEDRQYLRNDIGAALAAFRRRRTETLAHLGALSPEEWRRGGVHPRRGRMTVGDFVRDMAQHDDNHLAQLRRALETPGEYIYSFGGDPSSRQRPRRRSPKT